MSQVYPTNSQNCATCEHWAGRRKPSAFRDGAEVEDINDKGECVGGGFDRMQLTAFGSCSIWRKWGVLW